MSPFTGNCNKIKFFNCWKHSLGSRYFKKVTILEIESISSQGINNRKIEV